MYNSTARYHKTSLYRFKKLLSRYHFYLSPVRVQYHIVSVLHGLEGPGFVAAPRVEPRPQ